MTDLTIKRIRLVFGILLSAVTAVAGLCLIAACLNIYYSGDKPFSPQSVAAAFAPIALPVYLCLALVILGFLLDFFCPPAQKGSAPGAAPHMTLSRLYQRMDPDTLPPEALAGIRTERRGRRVRTAAGVLLLIIGAAVYLPYGLDGGNFHQTEITASMIRAMWLLLPCVGVPFVWSVVTGYLNRASLLREIRLLSGAKPRQTPAPAPRQSERAVTVLRVVLLAAAAILLLAGLFTGGAADVLTKAVNICTECIGLG